MSRDEPPRPASDPEALVEGVMAGDRGALARAITLVESRRSEDSLAGQRLIERVLPLAGGAVRVGLSGLPGVGKSTLADTLGMHLLERGYRVAVLAVDPSSTISGGSILGDKSRMPRLASDPRAFIRPSPSVQALGGVARRTQEALLLCEAAGYDVVLVETVGVGQSELDVSDMVDTFVLLLLPGAGDELQGLKKGVLELADIIAVNKADGELRDQALRTRSDYAAALRYLGSGSADRRPEVLALSARTGDGVEALWSQIEAHRRSLERRGEMESRRREQRRRWMWRLVEEGVMDAFRSDARVQARLAEIEARVRRGEITAARGAEELLGAWLDRPS